MTKLGYLINTMVVNIRNALDTVYHINRIVKLSKNDGKAFKELSLKPRNKRQLLPLDKGYSSQT